MRELVRALRSLLGFVVFGCGAEDGPTPEAEEPPVCTDVGPFYQAGECPEDLTPIPDAPLGFVLFGRDRQIFRADFDGCGARRVTECPAGTEPFERFALGVSAEGDWFAFLEYRYLDAPSRMIISRADGSFAFAAHAPGLGDARYSSFFVSDPAGLVFDVGDLFTSELWFSPLDGGEASPISGASSYLATASTDGSVLIYGTAERASTPAEQRVFWRLDLQTRARMELARIGRDRDISLIAFTRDARWAVYSWSSRTSTAAGWVAVDAGGARIMGEQPIATIVAPGLGSDLVVVHTSTIALLALPAPVPRTIYEAPPGSSFMRVQTVPGARSLLFTELSPVAEASVDPVRGNLIELDLESGSTRILGGADDLHVAEFISGDGRFVLEGVFRLPCPTSFAIPSNRLWGRVATLLRDRATGDARTLSTDPRVNPLGFSSDGRAAILGLPEWSEEDPDASYVRRYRIAAYMIEEDRSIDVVDYDVGVAHGHSEQWGLRVVPKVEGQAIFPEHLIGSCPR